MTLVVLTLNEERNLAACLESVAGWARDVFVVDSGSTDGTAPIAARFGATLVTHAFETHARQWQWALTELPISTEWVLGLDADQRVTPALRASIDRALSAGGPNNGYYVRRRQIFRGRWIRHGGYYPKYLLKLFRRDAVRLDPTELVDHHFHVSGPVAKLEADLIEDNKNEAAIAAWTAKHNRYAVLQATQDFASATAAPADAAGSFVGSPDERTRELKRLWNRLPLYVRPCLYVFYRYILRLGFLDGKEGFIFHVLQGFWYRMLVDINLDEIRDAAARAGDKQGVAAFERPLLKAKKSDS